MTPFKMVQRIKRTIESVFTQALSRNSFRSRNDTFSLRSYPCRIGSCAVSNIYFLFIFYLFSCFSVRVPEFYVLGFYSARFKPRSDLVLSCPLLHKKQPRIWEPSRHRPNPGPDLYFIIPFSQNRICAFGVKLRFLRVQKPKGSFGLRAEHRSGSWLLHRPLPDCAYCGKPLLRCQVRPQGHSETLRRNHSA